MNNIVRNMICFLSLRLDRSAYNERTNVLRFPVQLNSTITILDSPEISSIGLKCKKLLFIRVIILTKLIEYLLSMVLIVFTQNASHLTNGN